MENPDRTERVDSQYNHFSATYSENREETDLVGDRRFYEMLATVDLKGKAVLDIGCGDGSDLVKFSQMGASEVSGIDPSEAFAKVAQEKNPGAHIIIGRGESLPFESGEFDIVTSKYALQTSPNVPAILMEASRVLREGGHFIFLSKHPLRQFLEKIEMMKGQGVDYFKQDIVDSHIYGGKIHLREPSHTLSEYLSPGILKNFDIESFIEDADFPASEQINGFNYPTFFVAKYKRRTLA